MPKVKYTAAKGLYQESGKGFTSPLLASSATQGSGTAIADDTTALTMTEADSGKIFTCALTTNAKVINLPASMPNGWNIRIVQIAVLANSGALTIKCLDGTDFIQVGSYAIPGGHSVAGDAAAAGDDKLTITGANTNCGWGIGSVLTITKVRDNNYLFEAIGGTTGTGSAALAFGAQ